MSNYIARRKFHRLYSGGTCGTLDVSASFMPPSKQSNHSMSYLQFDGQAHNLTLFSGEEHIVGSWVAYNNVDKRATLRHISNGRYDVIDKTRAHLHPASQYMAYGPHGIIRFIVPGHVGIGIHAGRTHARHAPGPKHPTMGCIRTTDEAMLNIVNWIARDPLDYVQIDRNHAFFAAMASRLHAIQFMHA